jgi:hypothetical protein
MLFTNPSKKTRLQGEISGHLPAPSEKRPLIGRRPTICLLGLFITLPVFGNGGLFNASAVYRTGNLVPMEKRLISLETERLNIRIEKDDAMVEVTYVLVNHGPSDSVTFGFPVDVATPETLNTPNGYDYVFSNSLRDFAVTDGTEEIKVEKVIDKPLAATDQPTGIDPQVKIVRRWSIVALKFERGEHKSLTVSYKVRCIALDKGFEGDTLWKYGIRTLLYTFRPAATWGNGRVGSLVIRLDTTWLSDNDLPVTRLAPGGSSDVRGMKLWEFHDQDLLKIPDLICCYDSSELYLDHDIKRNLLAPEHIKSLTVSSTLKPEGSLSYAKESMRDNDLRTAWVEGVDGPGIGESITFKPNGAYVTEIGILNGYVADESRYYANARVKKMRVEVEFGEGAEPNEKRKRYDISLPDREYKTLKPRYPFSSVDWIVQHSQGNGFIDKVKLTILEVYPGQRYEDTAISELYICGFRR